MVSTYRVVTDLPNWLHTNVLAGAGFCFS